MCTISICDLYNLSAWKQLISICFGIIFSSFDCLYFYFGLFFFFSRLSVMFFCLKWYFSLYVSDLAAIGWTHKLPPHSTWWGRWVRSVDRVQGPPFLNSPPGPRPCWDAGGRRLEREPEQGPRGQSWLQTAEMAAPRSWTCLNRGWTPPDWAVRHVVTTQNRPEPAAVTRTASRIARRRTWCQGRVL